MQICSQTLQRVAFAQIVVFLGFLVSAKGVELEEEKIKAIKDWPTPSTITKQSFHGLARFYLRLMSNF